MLGRAASRGFVLAVAIAFACGGGLAGWRAVDDARGATVEAEVVAITTNVPGRRVYDVRFATAAGRACESRVDSGSNPEPREIHVGGRAMVHYSASDPCRSFLLRETTEPAAGWFVIVALAGITACFVVIYRLRPGKSR